MAKTLLEKTRALMSKTNRPVSETCKKLGMTRRWYNMVLKGDIPNPGVNTIEALYNMLRGKK